MRTQRKTKHFLVASGEKLGFQITLLLSSYIYFDVFQDLLPPFDKTINTPAALIFFVILIIIQFFTIIGSDLIHMYIIILNATIDTVSKILHIQFQCSEAFMNRLKVCLWEQRLETNGWEKPWFQSFVNKVTQSKIKEDDFKDDDGDLDVEEFE